MQPFLDRLVKLASEKNNAIRKIDFALAMLNSALYNYVSEYPEIVNNSFEPNAVPSEKFIFGEYPDVYVFLPPFKTALSYENIVALAEDNYEVSNISEIVINLICDRFKNSLL